MTLLGNRVFADHQVERGISNRYLNRYLKCPFKKRTFRHRNTHTVKRSHEDEGWNQGRDASRSQGHQGLPATCRSWREAWIRHDLMASEGTSPAHTLILDFRPPELWGNHRFCCLSHLVWGPLLRHIKVRNLHDKTRQCTKQQRHHFASKGPCSQSYGVSSSHVQMWDLDHKEGWAPKNWYFQIVALEKTLESPLESLYKEIKPVNLKGN